MSIEFEQGSAHTPTPQPQPGRSGKRSVEGPSSCPGLWPAVTFLMAGGSSIGGGDVGELWPVTVPV